MSYRNVLCLIAAVILLGATAAFSANTPERISYQGVLLDSGGQPVTTQKTVTFLIYDVPSEGTPIWWEERIVTPDHRGNFSIALGDNTSLTDQIFTEAERYLAIQVLGDPEMSTRVKLASSPYSLRISTVDGAKAGMIKGALTVTASTPSLHKGSESALEDARLTLQGAPGSNVIDMYPGTGLVMRATNDANQEVLSVGIDDLDQELDLVIRGTGGDEEAIYTSSSVGLSSTANGSVMMSTSGDAFTVKDATGDTRIAASFDGTSSKITVFEPTGAARAGEQMLVAPRFELSSEGIRIFGSSYEDVVGIITPTGDLYSKGQAVMGQTGVAMKKMANSSSPFSAWSTVFGFNNTATGDSSTVSGGYDNSASGMISTIGGGYGNQATGGAATIGGGNVNKALYTYVTIAGGNQNIGTAYGATIAGGQLDSASGQMSFVGSGQGNHASGDLSAIAGGISNKATGYSSFVGGGVNNKAEGATAVVAGGDGNHALGARSTVSGGIYDSSLAHYATVAGGLYNTASGQAAMIPGGDRNRAAGDYSLAAGRNAKANHAGSFVWGDAYNGNVASSANNQFIARASGGVTFYSNTALTAGVTLSAGGGGWSAVSDRNLKANVTPVDSRDVLEKVAALPMSTWNYLSQDESIRHMGPMAQDLYQQFGLGENDTHINTIDADGVALAAIQGLYQQNQELKQENEEIKARLAQMQEMLQQLMKDQE